LPGGTRPRLTWARCSPARRDSPAVVEGMKNGAQDFIEKPFDPYTAVLRVRDAVEIWGKQRVLRGDGKVRTIGKPLWTGLIASFPNLSNTVQSVTSNDDGDVVVQADIEGTQNLAWGLIAPAGRHYREPHLFVFHVGPDLLIDDITAYWNDAGISQQLGHNEVD